MIITNLEIENFRGIKHCDISFPIDTKVICLIGAGDNTKSTLLSAIEWIVYPAWNLQACDMDFYNCNTNNLIVLRGTFAEIPEKLMQEDKFGLYLRKSGVALKKDEDSQDGNSGEINLLSIQPTVDTNDEPKDGEPVCITIQLTIPSSLEPKWEVVCNRQEPKAISQNDRRLMAAASVGHDCGKDMVWGRYSVLQKYADGANSTLHSAYTEAIRTAAGKVSLDSLDGIANELKKVGQHYGVDFSADIKNRLLLQNSYYSTSVGVFDGNVPLNQRGTGSQRLLSMGLNIDAFEGGTLLLVDEIESGLEPYRLRSLINEFRTSHKDHGQVIMTTHSPVAVAECTIDEIMVVRSDDGETRGYTLKTDKPKENYAMQGEVRRNAEAFLTRRLIVCEGKTEQGFIRAMDYFLAKNRSFYMAYRGVGTANGNGDQIFGCVDKLFSSGYDVCLLMDSDKPNLESDKTKRRNKNIAVFDWDAPNSLEQQVFRDTPKNVAEAVMNAIASEYSIDSVTSKLKKYGFTDFKVEDEKIVLTYTAAQEQWKLGDIAKNDDVAWFKRISLGECVGNVIFEDWDKIDQNTKLHKTVDALIA